MSTYNYSYNHTITIPTLEELVLQTTRLGVAAVFLWDGSAGGVGAFTDYTTEANEDTADDVPLLAPSPMQLGDGIYFGGTAPFDWIFFDITTAGVGTYQNLYWEYWNGSTWDRISTGVTLPNDYFYDTDVADFKVSSPPYRHYMMNEPPDDFAQTTVNGSTLYWVRCMYNSPAGGDWTTLPLARRVYLGGPSVAHTAAWSDTMAIDDTQSGQFYFGVSPTWNDNMAIDDTQAGQWSAVVNFLRSWSDVMDITDLTDTEGMQFQISVVFSDIMDIIDLADIEGLAITFARSFHDIMEIVDTLSLGSRLVVSDVMDITDQGLTFNIGLNLTDIMEIIDQGWAGLDWARAFHDVMTITDSILWRGDYPAPVYLRFAARRPQITIYTKDAKKE